MRDYAIFRFGPDGTVASWNAGAERLFGFSAAEAIGKPLDAFFPPEERAQVPSYFIEAATRGRWDGSGWRLRRDGERFRALDTLTAARDSRDSLEGYIYLAHNVSERLEIEQSLRRSEATLAALLESAAQAVIATDESGRITLANARAEEYFGYPRAELLGRSLDMLLPALPPGEAAKRVETVARRKDGSEFPVEVGMSRADTDDNVTAIAIITDITERKRAEQELRRSHDDLRRFAFIAAHDLQEPLRAVTSYTQFLEKRYKGRLDPDADEFIRYIVAGALRMKVLLRDVQAYTTLLTDPSPEQRQMLDLNEVLRLALGGLKEQIAEAHAEVTHEPLPSTLGIGSELALLFQNLIDNAIKYRSAAAPRIHIRARRSGPEWVISVQDNGIGIDPRHVEQIFSIFRRLHGPEFSGSGAGLAICKKIVDRHGGRIWVDSRPGEGSEFYFTLPAEAS